MTGTMKTLIVLLMLSVPLSAQTGICDPTNRSGFLDFVTKLADSAFASGLAPADSTQVETENTYVLITKLGLDQICVMQKLNNDVAGLKTAMAALKTYDDSALKAAIADLQAQINYLKTSTTVIAAIGKPSVSTNTVSFKTALPSDIWFSYGSGHWSYCCAPTASGTNFSFPVTRYAVGTTVYYQIKAGYTVNGSYYYTVSPEYSFVVE